MWISAATRLRLTYQDDDEAQAVHEVWTDTAPVVAAVGARTLITRIAGVSDCTCVEYEIVVEELAGVEDTAPASSDVNRCGVLVFAVEDDDLAVVVIPSLREDLLMITGDYPYIELNTEDARIAAVIDAHVAGIGGIFLLDPFGRRYLELVAALVEWR